MKWTLDLTSYKAWRSIPSADANSVSSLSSRHQISHYYFSKIVRIAIMMNIYLYLPPSRPALGSGGGPWLLSPNILTSWALQMVNTATTPMISTSVCKKITRELFGNLISSSKIWIIFVIVAYKLLHPGDFISVMRCEEMLRVTCDFLKSL